MKGFKSISSLVESYLPHIEDPPSPDSVQHRLTQFWEITLGDLSLYSYPVLFESGRLVVFCETAVWATRFRHQSPSIVRTLKESGFVVKRAEVKVRPVSEVKPKPPAAPRDARPISQDTAHQIRSLAEQVQHDGVRDSLLRLARKAK